MGGNGNPGIQNVRAKAIANQYWICDGAFFHAQAIDTPRSTISWSCPIKEKRTWEVEKDACDKHLHPILHHIKQDNGSWLQRKTGILGSSGIKASPSQHRAIDLETNQVLFTGPLDMNIKLISSILFVVSFCKQMLDLFYQCIQCFKNKTVSFLTVVQEISCMPQI